MFATAPSNADRKSQLADSIEVVRDLLIEIMLEGGAFKDETVRGVQSPPSRKQDEEFYKCVCAAMRGGKLTPEIDQALDRSEIEAIGSIADAQLTNYVYMVEFTAWDLYQSQLRLRQQLQRGLHMSEKDEHIYQLQMHGLSKAAASKLLSYDKAGMEDCLHAVAWARFVMNIVVHGTKRDTFRRRADVKKLLSPEALEVTSPAQLRAMLNLYAPLPSRYQDDRKTAWFAGLLSIVVHARPASRRE